MRDNESLRSLTKEVKEITLEVLAQRKKVMNIIERTNIALGKGWGERCLKDLV